MHGITSENIHYWEGAIRQIMVSDENTKTLTAHKSIDDAINYLYLNGFKDSAREINKAKKG